MIRSVRLCSRLSLPSHLCMLDEVVRFSSAAPVSFPPWPPNLRLERQEVPLARSWSSGFRWRSCGSLCRFACRSRFSGRDAVSVDHLVSCFPMCGRCVSVGGLRTANVFPVFALVVSVGPVAVFSDR